MVSGKGKFQIICINEQSQHQCLVVLDIFSSFNDSSEIVVPRYDTANSSLFTEISSEFQHYMSYLFSCVFIDFFVAQGQESERED